MCVCGCTSEGGVHCPRDAMSFVNSRLHMCVSSKFVVLFPLRSARDRAHPSQGREMMIECMNVYVMRF